MTRMRAIRNVLLWAVGGLLIIAGAAMLSSAPAASLFGGILIITGGMFAALGTL